MYINDLLQRSAERFGRRTALIDGTAELTYAQLLGTVVGYARRLRGLGLGSGSTVAVRIDRSMDSVAVFLATQWIGAVYLPVDDRLPAARVRFMLEDAGCDCLILEDDAPEVADYRQTGVRLLPRSLLRPDAGPAAEDPPAELGDTAYVLYTSGSTGLPKAVPISADNLSFFVEWLRDTYTPDEVALCAFTISVGFDVSFAEILAPLVHGGTLALFEDLFQVEGTKLRLTALANVPGNLSRYLERCTLPETLKVVTSLGEPLLSELARKITAGGPLRLINAYGPTEATIYATHHVVSPADLDHAAVPIGLPLAGTAAEVLGPDGSPCGDGEPGELVITGPNVAAGYLSAHARSSTAFFRQQGAAHPSYRTGDIVVRAPSGVLTCLGRLDRQCKVNGIRVDLQEVTSHLLNCAGVANGHICTRQTPGGTRLAAFVTSEPDATPHPADIRAKLAVDLPRYCVPHDITVVKALPTTMSGKVDEAALVDLLTRGDTGEAGGAGVVDQVIARCTGTTEADGDPVPLQALTSLEIIGVRQKLLREHATDISLREIYRCRDLDELTALVRRQWGNAGEALPSDAGCGVGEQNIWLADMYQPGYCGNNEIYRLTFTRAVTAEQVEAALQECVRAFPALRTAYHLRQGKLVKEVADDRAAGFRLGVVPPDRLAEGRNAAAFGRRTFDLAAPLKIRARYLPGDRPVVLLSIHHIAIDAVAVDTLLEHFENVLLARPAPCPQPAAADRTGTVDAQELHPYWHQQLEVLGASIEVPVPAGDVAERREARIAGEAYLALIRTAAKARTSVFCIVHAALATALGQQLGVTAVSLGTPMTRRAAGDRQVACLTNLVPLIAAPRADGTPVLAYLTRLRHDLLETLDHSDISLSDLRTVQARPDSLLMHAMFAEIRQPAPKVGLFEAVEVFTGIAKLPLMFLFEQRADSLTLVGEHIPGESATAFVEAVVAETVREIGALSTAVAAAGVADETGSQTN
ncbi:AMP-binding protein [Streptomyces sp. NPDC051162]|uniref:amino acid adenylation domain-containing protein n=1 Tax=Streptomyces sp. NPDC051162 TaxID=3154747 RepID=UPI003429F041